MGYLLYYCYILNCQCKFVIFEVVLCQFYLFIYLLTPVAAVMPPCRAHGSPQDLSGESMSPAAMLAAMQAMQQELAILRQAIPVAPTRAAQGVGGGGVPGGTVWQNLPSYWAHMHMSLSQRPQTAMHVHQIT
jgi:hypothetical protein